MRRCVVLPVAILCMLMNCSSGAQPNATDILKKSYEAETRASLTGRMRTTLYTGSAATTGDIAICRSGRQVRMDYLSGPSAGMSILDDGRSMTRLDSRTKTAYVSGTPEAPEHLSLLLANYTPVVTGTGRVAGRDCYVLAIRPKYPGNPSKRLWIDQSTFVALKTERFGSDGKPTMSTEYTSVDYSKRPSASLFVVAKGWRTVRLAASGDSSLDAVRKAVGFIPVKPGYVPKGYRFDGYYLRENPRGIRFAGLRYTNGMNTISVYEHDRPCLGGRGPGRGMGMGRGQEPRAGRCAGCILAETPHAQMARVFVGDLMVIVVGDISTAELQNMANSFR